MALYLKNFFLMHQTSMWHFKFICNSTYKHNINLHLFFAYETFVFPKNFRPNGTLIRQVCLFLNKCLNESGILIFFDSEFKSNLFHKKKSKLFRKYYITECNMHIILIGAKL